MQIIPLKKIQNGFLRIMNKTGISLHTKTMTMKGANQLYEPLIDNVGDA